MNDCQTRNHRHLTSHRTRNWISVTGRNWRKVLEWRTVMLWKNFVDFCIRRKIFFRIFSYSSTTYISIFIRCWYRIIISLFYFQYFTFVNKWKFNIFDSYICQLFCWSFQSSCIPNGMFFFVFSIFKKHPDAGITDLQAVYFRLTKQIFSSPPNDALLRQQN